ncbi:MAG: DUF1850 domain-containing protein [Sphaerochaeta associata]|uniref:DUF1850 domain-containing protein n=1 Tax=Sphaerochaeta associata TaxID=1129264 RepID=UPI00183BEDBB|nr:DUF1850 domain-containing protein [Sphaerochaeta associata]MEA5107172.1 DUF1850 domain-containing protein [Sphaerochaeta associata]NLA97058.1 DUF1850 domain-containing protein [Spirochaetales bacterium]
MKSRALVLVLVLLILLMGTLLFSYFFQGPDLRLVLSDQETGQVLFSQPVQEGDELSFHWIHSFEHIPWVEEYTIEANETFLLHTISVAGFGAGIPENKGVVTVEDGMVVMRSIQQQFDTIRWIHSQTALVSITLGQTTFITGEDVEHHLPVELSIKGTRTLWPRLRLTK